jgi:hypothetical protein
MTSTTTERETILYPTKDGRLIPVHADEMAEFEKKFGEYLATEEEWNAATNADIDTIVDWWIPKTITTEEEFKEWLGPETWEWDPPRADSDDDDREELFVNNESIFAAELRHRLGTGALAGVFRKANKLVRTPRVGEEGYVPPEDPRDDDGPAQVQVIDPELLAAMVDVRYNVQRLVEDKEASKEKGEPVFTNKQALELIASGAVPVADLITHRLPLEQAIEGIHTVTRGEAIKVTIEA